MKKSCCAKKWCIQYFYDHKKLLGKFCCVKKSAAEVAKMLDKMAPDKKKEK